MGDTRRMKVFAVLLLAVFALGHQTQESEREQFYKFAVAKAMESCLGKDNVNKYTVNMKKAVAKCEQQDAPELDLPPFRSMYKFVNPIISSANRMDQQKLHQVFVALRIMTNVQDYTTNFNSNSGSNWLKEKFMKYKMHQMMKHMMNEDEDDFHVRPYSFDTKMDNKIGKFEMMKMMKDIMNENNYSQSSDNYEMKKMMEKFFGNDHSADQYEMMEKFFKNDDQMDALEKMYGSDYKMTNQDYNKFDMMKLANEKNFDSQDYKNYNYAPQQARFRFKRQAPESTKPHQKPDYTKPAPGLDRGDRLFAKLQEQKREMEARVGNMTCVLRETKVLNKDNEIDIKSLKQSMQQYTLPSPWFKNRFEELIDICHETAVNIPADISDEHNIEGQFGSVNLAHVKTFMKCCKEGKQKLCMNQDTKNKIESNFGPIKDILEQTKLTEYQLFPLVQQMLQGEESEYLGLLWICGSWYNLIQKSHSGYLKATMSSNKKPEFDIANK